jgi:hypothetical protein
MLRLFCSAALMLTGIQHVATAQTPTQLTSTDAIAGVIEAFRSHDVVALPDAHGNAESHAFRMALIRDRSFAETVDDIVIELGNALYQDIADRYVRGDDVSLSDLRKIWQDTTVTTAGNNYVMAHELLDAVRAVNRSRKDSRVLRVLLGDPPIEWDRVKERADYQQYFAFRQSHPAAVAITEVLARRRKALLMYGALHLQRRNIQANYNMNAVEVQTPVSLIEKATSSRVFVIWEVDTETLGPESKSWHWPALALVAGTAFGASDFATLVPKRLAEERGTFASGKFVPIPAAEFRRIPIAEQVDAVLYLGPRTPPRRSHEVPRELCSEPGWLEEQVRRIALSAPEPEAERLKEYCATAR